MTTSVKNRVDRVIPRHQEMSESERQALKLKRQIKLQNKEFKIAQKQNRPRLNKTKSLEEFGEYAEATAKALSTLALRVMSLQTAFGYAESMIRLDIEGEGVEWDNNASFKIAEKIQAIESTRIMLKHFNIPKALTNAIMEQTIAKQFGTPGVVPVSNTPPSNPSIPTFTTTQIREMLEAAGREIDKGEK